MDKSPESFNEMHMPLSFIWRFENGNLKPTSSQLESCLGKPKQNPWEAEHLSIEQIFTEDLWCVRISVRCSEHHSSHDLSFHRASLVF